MAIPRRRFGKSHVEVSALGLGGHHLGGMASYAEMERVVHEALDAGITFFDCAWEYHNGRAEEWIGRALAGRRDKAFIMTKVCVHGDGKDVAMRMLEESLRRYQTDHLDCWQIHGVCFEDEPRRYRLPGGALEALDLAKRQGKTHFVGFTGHKNPAIHLRMLATGYPFDSVQMPLNPFDWHFRSFEKKVLPELVKRDLARLGMKPMQGHGDAITRGVVTAGELLRYAMSLPVTVTISGSDSLEVLRQNVAVADSFKPLSEPEMQAIRDKVAPAAADGRFEMYKVSLQFDNPVARRNHGFLPDEQQIEFHEDIAETQGQVGPE
jgi:aryl-alcohol dehydrogenase-like predicted oxidoreductase